MAHRNSRPTKASNWQAANSPIPWLASSATFQKILSLAGNATR